mgnify:CR=1 FL=1
MKYIKIKKIDKALAWYEAISVGGYKEKEAMQILKKPDLKYTNQKLQKQPSQNAVL